MTTQSNTSQAGERTQLNIGDKVMRIAKDYTGGRIGTVIEVSAEKGRARVRWTAEKSGKPMNLRTWVRWYDLQRCGEALSTDIPQLKTITIKQPVTDQEPTSIVVVVTDGGFWGKGIDLENALQSAVKAGAKGAQQCVVYLYTGEQSELNKISVDNYGGISYPTTVASYRVGNVSLRMKQPAR